LDKKIGRHLLTAYFEVLCTPMLWR